MKFFVALALCLALASCSPLSRNRRGEKEGSKSGGGSSGDEEEDWETPMNVHDFREEMRALVDHVYGMDKTIEQFGEVAGHVLIEDPTPEKYEDLGGKWETMTGQIGSDFDHVALNLVKLGYKLYLGAEGFDEVNHCQSFKNIPAPDPATKSMEDSLREMGYVFLADLQCFRDLFQEVSEVEAVLDANEGNMPDDTAMGLVLKFIERLHLIRINAIRFKAAVEKSVNELSAAHEQPTQEVKKLLKLRSLLMKSGLLN